MTQSDTNVLKESLWLVCGEQTLKGGLEAELIRRLAKVYVR